MMKSSPNSRPPSFRRTGFQKNVPSNWSTAWRTWQARMSKSSGRQKEDQPHTSGLFKGLKNRKKLNCGLVPRNRICYQNRVDSGRTCMHLSSRETPAIRASTSGSPIEFICRSDTSLIFVSGNRFHPLRHSLGMDGSHISHSDFFVMGLRLLSE